MYCYALSRSNAPSRNIGLIIDGTDLVFLRTKFKGLPPVICRKKESVNFTDVTNRNKKKLFSKWMNSLFLFTVTMYFAVLMQMIIGSLKSCHHMISMLSVLPLHLSWKDWPPKHKMSQRGENQQKESVEKNYKCKLSTLN